MKRYLALGAVGLVVLSLASAAGATVQRGRATDEAVAREVLARLISHDITGVSVSVESGIVTLRGTARTLWLKKRARAQALEVVDVISVVNEVTVPRGESDEVLTALVATQLGHSIFLTIFDDADVEVDDGLVTLKGRVTLPYKAQALADLAARVPGVQKVRNKVQTLPVSRFDDELRYAVARRIYGDDLFSGYATQPRPPVHIIVEHGNVTLTGVVVSDVERRAAEAIARSTFAVMSVTNKLRVEKDE